VHVLEGNASKAWHQLAWHQLGWRPQCDFRQLIEMMVEHDMTVV